MSELEEKKKRKKRKKAGTESSKESSLRDWFKRKGAKGKKGGWVDCNAPDGKGGYKSCGRGSGEKRKKYPACRPTPAACKERGRGKSWGKKGSKKKRNEGMELTTEEIRQMIVEELQAVLDEKRKNRKKRIRSKGKRDACYHKVRSRYKVWPSAYASGALVKCRKVGAKNWGNKSKKNENLDEEFIPGGEASKYGQIPVEAMIVAIADEHGVDPEKIREQFEMGVEEEMEHAQEEAIAHEIALDHLVEDPEYYTKLDKANLEESEFKPHEMFDPKTGKKEKTKVEKDHHRLAKKGYVHVDPKDIEKILNDEGGAAGLDPFLDELGKELEDEIIKALKGMTNVGQHKSGDYILADDEEIKVVSEALQYHLDHGVGVDKNVFRPGSQKFYAVFREARKLFKEGKYKPHNREEQEMLESDLGEFGLYEGEKVPLDSPMLNEKKDPPLNKPMKNSGGGKKYKVYVRNPKTGRIKMITYGDSKGGLKGNWNNAEARKSFAARHNCADKKDKMKAGYWACRAHKHFGKNVPGRFW
jgi:hypothetical protein